MVDSSLMGNKFWDTFNDKKHEDLRKLFVRELIQYYETYPHRLKKGVKKTAIRFEGLFGTGSGIAIMKEAFPLKKDSSILQLIYDFCTENGIPYDIYCSGSTYYVFSNKYTRMCHEHLHSSKYSNKELNEVQIELYGEPLKRSYYSKLYIKYGSKIPGDDMPKMKSIIEDDLSIDDLNSLFSDKPFDKFEKVWADLYFYRGEPYVDGKITIEIISNRALSESEEKDLYRYILHILEPWKDNFDLHHFVDNVY